MNIYCCSNKPVLHRLVEPGQYVSICYTEHLDQAGITASVGSRGDSYDNSLAETVNGLYRAELIYTRPAWPSLTEVEFATMNRVHWWNHQRLHEALGYRTARATENAYHQTREPSTALT